MDVISTTTDGAVTGSTVQTARAAGRPAHPNGNVRSENSNMFLSFSEQTGCREIFHHTDEAEYSRLSDRPG